MKLWPNYNTHFGYHFLASCPGVAIGSLSRLKVGVLPFSRFLRSLTNKLFRKASCNTFDFTIVRFFGILIEMCAEVSLLQNGKFLPFLDSLELFKQSSMWMPLQIILLIASLTKAAWHFQTSRHFRSCVFVFKFMDAWPARPPLSQRILVKWVELRFLFANK